MEVRRTPSPGYAAVFVRGLAERAADAAFGRIADSVPSAPLSPHAPALSRGPGSGLGFELLTFDRRTRRETLHRAPEQCIASWPDVCSRAASRWDWETTGDDFRRWLYKHAVL